MPSNSIKSPLPKYFYSLDALRGLAALSVIIFHWQHFFHSDRNEFLFDVERQPLYCLLKPIYTDGWRAVDLFFCLSGFIFFWLYKGKISGKKISFTEFFILRFSRLYPLHFLTLIVVAAGQQFMLWQQGSFFVYSHNDLFHFLLQIVFASAWGWEQGFSFNGPVWSVSAEILCYLFFYLVCFLRLSRWWFLCILVFCAYFLKSDQVMVGRAFFSFFIGGLTYSLFGFLALKGSSSVCRWFIGLTVLMWVAVPYFASDDMLYQYYREHIWTVELNLYGKDIIGYLLLILPGLSFELILFPITILTLALWETHRGQLGKRLAFLGKISYSSYLVHFPLQMALVAVLNHITSGRDFFYTPASFLLFFSLLILLSKYVNNSFEGPCQALIRKKMRV